MIVAYSVVVVVPAGMDVVSVTVSVVPGRTDVVTLTTVLTTVLMTVEGTQGPLVVKVE